MLGGGVVVNVSQATSHDMVNDGGGQVFLPDFAS